MNITGNTVFIPGATSGIGLGLALRLRDKGNTVIVGGRRTDVLARLAEEHPGLGTVEIDTTDPASIEAAAASVLARYPSLDALITMAGIMRPEDLRDPGFLATAEATVETNLLGPIRLIAAFLPALLARPSATVITVTSGLAYVPLPLTPTYNATKAAVHSFTESLRVQLAGSSVQVIELVPPAVRTSLMNQENSPIAMPLDDYLDETVGLLEKQPDAQQILVERVRWQRDAVAEGRYDEVLGVLSGRYRD
ncbi:SDR family NAD(P)-dependent oxidoreductase [Actinoplanes sp. LDG1-06]|uniref:SDR family NAD(P)-dependent oxidoreductase n=1 Tax=Paractinoplanes ovalisporus TaxID=2810368 RepID=A0ABS2A7T3_9ACTN|nr:SDR family NAD(P)-dependent oxidoreductase [Actinoplanes ovalisporus]MBM2615886.1 SDR family NAD(P)-dependent oxidoreductase [Actinoplanes ovalisporus]